MKYLKSQSKLEVEQGLLVTIECAYHEFVETCLSPFCLPLLSVFLFCFDAELKDKRRGKIYLKK